MTIAFSNPSVLGFAIRIVKYSIKQWKSVVGMYFFRNFYFVPHGFNSCTDGVACLDKQFLRC